MSSEQNRAAALDAARGGDPFALAESWLKEAEASEPNDANAMSLATIDPDGAPNVRIVLLKEIEAAQPGAADPRGAFVFYTNFESAKGRELRAHPRAALNLHWKTLRRQIRIRGGVATATDAQADAYYDSRSYKSRIGAWASQQSQPLESREMLEKEAARFSALYPETPPRPPHWGGFRVTPEEIEFWIDGPHRLHDRFVWRWTGAEWSILRLNP